MKLPDLNSPSKPNLVSRVGHELACHEFWLVHGSQSNVLELKNCHKFWCSL